MSPTADQDASPEQRGNRSVLRAGFTLLEVLVALTIVAIALLLAIQLLVFDTRTQRRSEAQRETLEVLEGLVERLRSRDLPPMTVTLEEEQIEVLLDRSIRPMTIELSVTPHEEVPDLWNVVAHATYRAGLEAQDRTLQTRIWRP